MEGDSVLFDERFLQRYVGQKLLNDPITAVIELIANSWDAGANEVNIFWPEESNNYEFVINDNGAGITKESFEVIWKTLSYNRVKYKGEFAESIDGADKQRIAFGRNGVGRFAAFCFGEEYQVESKKSGKKVSYLVRKSQGATPLAFELTGEEDAAGHGTNIRSLNSRKIDMPATAVRSEIGMRFVADPGFKIFVNRTLVTIDDISKSNISRDEILAPGLGEIEVFTIDTVETDRTTKLHGLAWRVKNRLVGEVTWDYLSKKYNVDGRRIESKRYSFIINAEGLDTAVLHDWSGFDPEHPLTKKAEEAVFPFVWKKIVDLGKEKRGAELAMIRSRIQSTYARMTPVKQEKWEEFISIVQESCPSLNEKELGTIAEILAKLEVNRDQYQLLENLNRLDGEGLADLNDILEDWTVEYAKIVLDELRSRIELLNQLETTLYSAKADEVHELQPLFHRGLWIFGPEYETIEFTSNRGMTKVIQELFGKDVRGSTRRPDFAVLPDSTVGLDSYPEYDNEGGEIGIAKLTIVELKAPGVALKEAEIEQPWKYVKELYKHGVIRENYTSVTCFVVGESIDKYEAGERKKADDTVITKPLVYDTVFKRAKSRLFRLYDRMKEAPFMEKVDSRYTSYFTEKAVQPELEPVSE